MDKLFINVSKLLHTSTRLVEHTALTQKEVGKKNVVLWNSKPTAIDTTTYMEFKEALRKWPSKYYMFSHVLSYSDFCIALLCCLEYSLNHEVTVSIPERTYTTAWRSLQVIANTSTDKVTSWIRSHIEDRTAAGYCNSLGIVLDNVTISMPFREDREVANDLRDMETISSISALDKIVRVIPYSKDNNVGTNADLGRIFNSTNTPEGQLYDLELAHMTYNQRFY